MSPASSFDYYKELEISKTATRQEINSTYRRLAMIHHPDRNPSNIDSATSKFQRLSEAYETLSEPEKRHRYDDACAAGRAYSTSASAADGVFGFPFGPGSSFQESPFRTHESGNPFAKSKDHVNEEEQNSFFYLRVGTATLSQTAQETTARRDTEVRAAQAADAQRMREVEELRRKKTEKRNRQKAEKKARELADAAAKAAKERQDKQLLEADKIKQEVQWELANAVTLEQKQKTCLHASHWTKVKEEHKAKCGACHKKRGGFGFQCPYCDVSVCQMCQNQLSEKKKKLDKGG